MNFETTSTPRPATARSDPTRPRIRRVPAQALAWLRARVAWWLGLSLRNKMLVALIVVAVLVGLAAWQRHTERLAGLTIVAVSRGDIEDAVTALGNIQPLNYVDVGAQVSGQLQKLHVAIGDDVTTGQLLAEIDAQVQSARVAADRAQLANITAQLAEKRAQLLLATQQFERQKRLKAEDATSEDAYQVAETQRQAAAAQVESLSAQRDQTESTLKADEVTLGYSKIYAPMDGTVASLDARQGQTLNANQQAPILMRIADLRTMTVWTQVSEADIGRLNIGMNAYFTTLGSPDRRWTGTLRQILPTPETVNNVVLYTALFDVDNPTRALMTQMSAQVFFVVTAAQDVLTVPASALRPVRDGGGVPDGSRNAGAATQQGAGKPYRVTVVTPGGFLDQRTVHIGARDRISAEVLSGLNEGERVVAGRKASSNGRATNGSGGRPPRMGAHIGGPR